MTIPKSKQEFVALLKEHVLVVTFKKLDGKIRKMRATLKEEYVGALADVQNNNDTISVVDVDLYKLALEKQKSTASAWRAFRLDSVISVEEEK